MLCVVTKGSDTSSVDASVQVFSLFSMLFCQLPNISDTFGRKLENNTSRVNILYSVDLEFSLESWMKLSENVAFKHFLKLLRVNYKSEQSRKSVRADQSATFNPVILTTKHHNISLSLKLKFTD